MLNRMEHALTNVLLVIGSVCAIRFLWLVVREGEPVHPEFARVLDPVEQAGWKLEVIARAVARASKDPEFLGLGLLSLACLRQPRS